MQPHISGLYSALLTSSAVAIASDLVIAHGPPNSWDLNPWWPQAVATVVGVSLSVSLVLWKLQRSDLLPNARLRRQRRASLTLHDSLLQNVQGLIYRVQAAHDQLPEHPADAATILEATMTQCELALAKSRVDFERCVVSDDGASSGLLPMLRLFSVEAFEARNTTVAVVTLDELGQARELNSRLKATMHESARSMIGASLAVAGVRAVEIEVIYETEGFSLRLRDDRSRMHADAGNDAGRILLHRLRAELGIDACVRVWNGQKAGLEIEVSVPARAAYVHASSGSHDSVAYPDD